jgi:hypothetical protein
MATSHSPFVFRPNSDDGWARRDDRDGFPTRAIKLASRAAAQGVIGTCTPPGGALPRDLRRG